MRTRQLLHSIPPRSWLVSLLVTAGIGACSSDQRAGRQVPTEPQRMVDDQPCEDQFGLVYCNQLRQGIDFLVLSGDWWCRELGYAARARYSQPGGFVPGVGGTPTYDAFVPMQTGSCPSGWCSAGGTSLNSTFWTRSVSQKAG
jgi:hypothetical protein